MKSLLTLITLLFTTFACSNKQPPKDERSVVTETELQTEKTFKHVADFPTIKDTAEFILDLRRTFELEIHESPVQKDSQQITIFKKVKIYGSDKDYYFIEYDCKAGSMAGYPWKNQLLLTADGKLVKDLAGK